MRLLERPQLLIAVAIVLQWLTTLAVWLRADSVDVGALSLLNVVVLGPLAIGAAFVVGASVAGVALGAWTLLVWVALPWLAPAFTIASYDETLRADVLPLVTGLAGDRGFAEGTAILVALALLIRRGRGSTALGGALLAGVLAAWLWRAQGAGPLSLDAFEASMAGLREYFWSQRLLQWLPVAGVIAVARRSVPIALALGAWLGGYVLFRAARPDVGFEHGELFRELLPALPAYVLLASALPLLVPTLAARLGSLARPAGAA